MSLELGRRIAFTLGALLVYRIGSHIPLPGTDIKVWKHILGANAGGLLGLVNAISDDRHYDLVGYQLASIHNAFCAQADGRTGGNRSAQHVARRKLDNSVFGYQALRLRTLSRPRRAKKDQSHRVRPRSFERLIRPSYWCASR